HFPCINILSSLLSFCSHVTMTTQTHTLSLHDALPICLPRSPHRCNAALPTNRRVWAGSERLCARARSRQKIHARNKLIVLVPGRSEEHTSELQSRFDLVCRLLLEKKNRTKGLRRKFPL